MTDITLNTPVVIAPATEAITSSIVKVTYVEENYGFETEDGPGRRAPGRPSSVTAQVVLCQEPYVERRITVWEGDEYLAVRGTWTDETLYAKIKEILAA